MKYWRRAPLLLITCVSITYLLACSDHPSDHASLQHTSRESKNIPAKNTYPSVVAPELVGSYPGFTKSGGGYFYDDVLEYRVWYYPEGGGDDEYRGFAEYEAAVEFAKNTKDAEKPLVLVRQREWIDEPEPGKYIPRQGERLTEWSVEWLADTKRQADSIEKFIKHPRAIRTD